MVACAGARVLAKAFPEERVGVFARKNGKVEVVEYSELDPTEAAATFDSASLVLQPLMVVELPADTALDQ